MALLNECYNFLPDVVTIEPRLANDSYGQPTYGPAVSYRARVVAKEQLSVNDKSEERQTSVQVFVATTDAIASTSRITLPGGRKETIFSSSQYRDHMNQVSHTTLTF